VLDYAIVFVYFNSRAAIFLVFVLSEAVLFKGTEISTVGKLLSEMSLCAAAEVNRHVI